jgi:LysM repeat protein
MKISALSAAVFAIALTLIVTCTSVNAAAITKTTKTKKNTPANTAQTIPTVTYITVQQGDNLSSLATTYNTTMLRLFYANLSVTNPDLIYPGEKLILPSASQVLAPRPLPDDTPGTTTSNTQVTANEDPSTQQTSVTTDVAPSTGVWYELAKCESGGNWSIDTGNGFYGGLQFTLSSWRATGNQGYPNQASPSTQIAAAEILQSRQGWEAWPACSAKLGL